MGFLVYRSAFLNPLCLHSSFIRIARFHQYPHYNSFLLIDWDLPITLLAESVQASCCSSFLKSQPGHASMQAQAHRVKQAQMEVRLMGASALLQREKRDINNNANKGSSFYYGPRSFIGEATRSLTLLLHRAPSLESLGKCAFIWVRSTYDFSESRNDQLKYFNKQW